jgi:ABC-2 type transport system ATP-binding protein
LPDAAIRTSGLTRRFGKLVAVDRLDLDVPAGGVYAFLGPNGAGKSTTIRMLLGLLRPDGGNIVIGGRRMRRGEVGVLERTGALIEAPSLYPHLTGRENLEATRRLNGAAESRIGATLDRVRLTAAADRPVRTYSTGMRQRLGIALSLMAEPELLVLDEPTNGLDPAGMQEMRELIRSISRRDGRTVFLSSHLLAEVEQVATHVGIVAEGRLRFEGTLDELRSGAEEHVRIETSNPGGARELLERNGWTVSADEGGSLRISVRGDEQTARINAELVGAGHDLFHLSRERGVLEELFLELTRGEDRTKGEGR